jgi:hypothetical protein
MENEETKKLWRQIRDFSNKKKDWEPGQLDKVAETIGYVKPNKKEVK